MHRSAGPTSARCRSTYIDRDRPPGLQYRSWLAIDADEGELERILHQELPALTLIGVFDHDRLAAFATLEVDAESTVISYIAVDEGSQGRGPGSALAKVADAAGPGRGVYTETDDDSVDF